jgi:general stress protein 26
MIKYPQKTRQQKTISSESSQRIYGFLQTHPIGVLATVDPNGNPHATVIYFAINDKFEIGFVTKVETKKHDNIKRNNHVQLVSYEASSQATVQITGMAEDISDSPEASDIFTNTLRTSIQTSEAGIPPISKLLAGNYVVYRLRVKQIRMAIFARPDPGGYDIYETIDF